MSEFSIEEREREKESEATLKTEELSSKLATLPSRTLPSFSENDVQYCCLGAGCYWGTEYYIRYKFHNDNLDYGKILDGRVGFMSTNPYLGVTVPTTTEEVSDDSLLIIPSFVSSTAAPVAPPTYDGIKKDGNKHNYIEVFCFKFLGGPEYYKRLIKFFFQIHDPTTKNQQNNDKGVKYGSTIFYYNESQRKISEKLKKELQSYLIKSQKKTVKTDDSVPQMDKLDYKNTFITTRIMKKTKFFPAHEEHQEYLTKNEDGYCSHRMRFTEWPTSDEEDLEDHEEGDLALGVSEGDQELDF